MNRMLLFITQDGREGLPRNLQVLPAGLSMLRWQHYADTATDAWRARFKLWKLKYELLIIMGFILFIKAIF